MGHDLGRRFGEKSEKSNRRLKYFPFTFRRKKGNIVSIDVYRLYRSIMYTYVYNIRVL